jgi:hypothetical protein
METNLTPSADPARHDEEVAEINQANMPHWTRQMSRQELGKVLGSIYFLTHIAEALALQGKAVCFNNGTMHIEGSTYRDGKIITFSLRRNDGGKYSKCDRCQSSRMKSAKKSGDADDQKEGTAAMISVAHCV